MRLALHKKKPDYRGMLAFLSKSQTDLTDDEVKGVLKWGTRLRLGDTHKQLPAARKIVEWLTRTAWQTCNSPLTLWSPQGLRHQIPGSPWSPLGVPQTHSHQIPGSACCLRIKANEKFSTHLRAADKWLHKVILTLKRKRLPSMTEIVWCRNNKKLLLLLTDEKPLTEVPWVHLHSQGPPHSKP